MHQGLSSYFSGLANMASSISKNIGPSFMEIDCMDKDTYKKEFAKHYRISKDLIDIEEEDITLEQVLNEWLDDKKLVDSLLYWMGLQIGKPLQVYKVKNNKLIDALGRCDGGISMFYIVDDIYFVEFSEYMLCFSIGNNE